MRHTRTVTEGAVAAALFVVFLLITVYVPVMRILSVWFLPVPFVIYVVRNGIKPVLVLWGVTFVISFVVANFFGLFAMLTYGSGGLVTGWVYRQRRSAFAVLLGGSLAYTGGILLVFILSIVLFHDNIIDDTVQVLMNGIDSAKRTAASFGEDMGQSFHILEQQVQLVRYLAPTFFVLMGVLIAWITQLISTGVLRRFGGKYDVAFWLPFHEWRFPKSFLWVYFVVLIIGFFQKLTAGSFWYIAYINIMAILGLALTIQGFSFVFFLCYAKKIHKSLPILFVVFCFLFSSLFPIFGLVRIAGIVDLGFNIRKRMKPS